MKVRFAALFASMLMLMMPFVTMSLQNGDGVASIFGPPDLEISSLNAVPKEEGGFTITATITNRGSSTSNSALVDFWDEYDIVNGNRTVIGSQIKVPYLKSGDQYDVTVNWEPRTYSLHKIWATVAQEGASEEKTGSNNVATILVQLPDVMEFRSPLDGNEKEDVIGTFISGIPVKVPVEVLFDMAVEKDLLRVFIENGDEIRFVPVEADNVHSTTIDIGSLGPGLWNFSINSSYAGLDMERFNRTIEVRELPVWMSDLDSLSRTYDQETGQYVISGIQDITRWREPISLTGLDAETIIDLFPSENDLLLTARIGHDGSTALSIQGSLGIGINAGMVEIDIDTDHYIEDLWNEIRPLPIWGLGSVEDLQILDKRSMATLALDNRSVSFPIDPKVSGTIKVELYLDENDRENLISGSVKLDLEGSQTFLQRIYQGGFNEPIVEAMVNTTWKMNISNKGPDHRWIFNGQDVEPEIDISSNLFDMGLTLKNELDSGHQHIEPGGTSMALSEGGEAISVQIVKGTGHNSAVSIKGGGYDAGLDRDNRYKSSPVIVILPGDLPVIAWTKASDWSGDPEQRMSSLSIKTLVGIPSGPPEGNGISIENGLSYDLHPCLATDGRGNVSLVFTRDMDGDPTTSRDLEIFLSELKEGNWTSPFRITNNGLWDDHPDACFTEEGDLWITWTTSSGEGRIRYRDHETGLWSPDILFNDNDNTVAPGSLKISANGNLPVVTGIIMGSDGGTDIISRLCDREEEGVFVSEQLIASSGGRISDISMTSGMEESCLATWSDDGSGNGDIWTSLGNCQDQNFSWTRPLPLTSDDKRQMTSSFIWTGSGSIDGAYLEMEIISNSTSNVTETLRSLDLSNCGEITDVRHELLGEYSRFETVAINVDIENIGLSPDGQVYVNLDRESYDPETGRWSDLSLDSKLVQFSSFKTRETVEFTTTLVDHQQRYRVWSASGWGYPPPYVSEGYINLPMVSDPVFEEVSLEPAGEGLISVMKVQINNRGQVSIPSLNIRILALTGLEEVDHDRIGEDLFTNYGETLNSSSIEIGAGASQDLEFGLQLKPGRNMIMAEMDYSGGYRSIKRPLVVDLFPDLELMAPKKDEIVISRNVVRTSAVLANRGEVSISPTGENRNATVTIRLLSQGGSERLVSYTSRTPIPGKGYPTELNFSIDTGDLSPGTYILETVVGDIGWIPGSDLEPLRSSRRIIIVEEQKASILEHEFEDRRGAGKVITVRIGNDSNRTLSATRLTLFNGRPDDDIIVSDVLTGGISPKGNGTVEIVFDLEAGLYYLTLVLSSSDVNNVSVPWNDGMLDQKGFQLEITEDEEEDDQESEIDMKEVTDSLMIGGAAAASVLALAFFIKKKDEEDEEENE